MSKETFLKILNQLKDIQYKGRISYHFYNEPLLHPLLDEFIQLSKEILPETRSEILTNGMFLTDEKYHGLRRAGVDKFTVTKHQNLKRIAFDDTFSKLNEEEKKSIMYYSYTQLTYSNRGGLVDYGKPLAPDQSLKRPCFIPSCTAIITVKGNVLTCYEDYRQKNVMGNIHEEHIKDIWDKPAYQEFRNDLKRGERFKHSVCSTCNNMQIIQ